PIAVSSWTTSGEPLSDGSTVLRLTMIGSSSTPSLRSSVSASASRSIHRLFVLTKGWRLTSCSAARSSSGVWAVSRGRRRPRAREVTALAIGLGAPRHLHHERDLLARHPAQDARLEHGAEVVGVGHEGPAVAVLAQLAEHARGHHRRVEVAVARGRPLEAGVV